MRSLDLLVAREPSPKSLPLPDGAVPSGTRERRRSASEVLDVFLAGERTHSARLGEAQAACVLRDLGFALADLGRRARGKAIVRFYDEPWEMCVERLGPVASLSVYRAGAEPRVAVYDRYVAFDEIVETVREAVRGAQVRGAVSSGGPDEGAERGRVPASVAIELEAADAALGAVGPSPMEQGVTAAPSPVIVELDRDAPVAFAAEFALRTGASSESDPSVERADLHALLFRGRLRAEIRGRAVEVTEAHPFLVAERLVEVARRALESLERGIAYNVRGEAGGLLLGVRVSPDGKLALTLGAADGRRDRADCTFPALGVADFVEASLAFGRALVRALLRRDRAQCTNLRLSAFRRQLREAGEALREVSRQDSKINPTPEPYRAFAEHARHAARPASASTSSQGATATSGDPLRATRLRYAVRWRALVPGIDLRATFLCGDRLVVGASAEMFCLARQSGEVIWRAPAARATSVVTPGGIARIHPDGTLAVHDFGNGEVTLKTRLAPRLGGPPAGAVVHLPGLPRLLIVTEGERHLVAIDLTSGESRWRFTWGKSDRAARADGWDTPIAKTPSLRMKRAGKLLYFTSGDSALTALDVQTGSIVWRVRDRLRFRASPTLDHDLLFALAGGASSLAKLHAIDPFSGHVRWSRPLPDPPTACSVEGAPLVAGDTIALAVRERNGLRLAAFDRETGAPRWKSPGPIAPVGTSWLAIDDLFVGNAPNGEIVGIEASTGELRYRQILAPRALESDVPRRLEPVLRSGALFVPHTDVHVLRPRDGAVLATIAPCEAIPDMLRVDEHCHVYIAEESGHMVSFGALPRLSLVPALTSLTRG